MNSLERRTRWLLHAYPAAWREQRGDELVGTVLDLAADGRRWPGARITVDLLVGGWRERARSHVATAGLPGAGWRLAATLAVLIQAAVSLVWLRDWLQVGHQPILPMLGAASAVTYVLSQAAFLAATVTWLTGLRRTTRWLAGLALAAWLVTAGVFNVMSNIQGGELLLDLTPALVWTYLAAVATAGLWQPRPVAPRWVGVVSLVVLLVALLTGTGAVQPDSGRVPMG